MRKTSSRSSWHCNENLPVAYDQENVVFRQSCISLTEEQAVGDKTARGGEE